MLLFTESEKSPSVEIFTNFLPSESPSFEANEPVVQGFAGLETGFDLTGAAGLTFTSFGAGGLLHPAIISRERKY